MSPTNKAIIHTVAFYDAVGKIPLTSIELYKYLINPTWSNSRVSGEYSTTPLSFGDFLKLLEQEWATLDPYIKHYRGFYSLKKNTHAYKRRIGDGKTSIKKWRIAQNMSRIISFLPYVRMVAVTGSLAHHATNKNSDIDILIAAKNGHIWTTRMLVSVVTHLLGKRRYGRKIKNRICLNHYIADTALSLRPKYIFSAHIYASCMPLWDKNHTYKTFVENNEKSTNLYLPNLTKERTYYHFKSLSRRLGPIYKLSSIVEYLLTKIISKKLELLFKFLQLKRIHRSIAYTQGKENRAKNQNTIFDDCALVFHHPRPQNQKALFLYKQNLKELGLCL